MLLGPGAAVRGALPACAPAEVSDLIERCESAEDERELRMVLEMFRERDFDEQISRFIGGRLIALCYQVGEPVAMRLLTPICKVGFRQAQTAPRGREALACLAEERGEFSGLVRECFAAVERDGLDLVTRTAILELLVWLCVDSCVSLQILRQLLTRWGVEGVSSGVEDIETRIFWWRVGARRSRELEREFVVGIIEATVRQMSREAGALQGFRYLVRSFPGRWEEELSQQAGELGVLLWEVVLDLLEDGRWSVTEVYPRELVLAGIGDEGSRTACLRVAAYEAEARSQPWSHSDLMLLSGVLESRDAWPWSAKREAAVLELTLVETLGEEQLRAWWERLDPEACSSRLEEVLGVAEEGKGLLSRTLRRLRRVTRGLAGRELFDQLSAGV
jgi:hypothetical protein